MEEHRSPYAGAAWLEGAGFLKHQRLSDLGLEVADLLGDLFFGIYHMSYSALRKANWDNETWIEIVVDVELATFDDSVLTRLVVLCHDRKLRCALRGTGPGYTRLIFHKRHRRAGRMHERHPTIEDATRSIRKVYSGGQDV